MDIELAFALSARTWSDQLHRFLADHGGARVRMTAMQPEDVISEDFDVLLIDDTCSFLTPRLVERLLAKGRSVIGVYDPDEFDDGKTRLVECGVSDVIEAAASPDEFLSMIGRVADGIRSDAPVIERSTPVTRPSMIGIAGSAGGVGTTEVAIHVAARLTRIRLTYLMDMDRGAPSMAQRLGAELHPNIRTALDVIDHRTGPIDRVFQRMHDVSFLAGSRSVSEDRAWRVPGLLAEVLPVDAFVVADLGHRAEDLIRFPLSSVSDRLLVVGVGTPVGIARVLEKLAVIDPDLPVDILINRAPSDRFRRAEILDEITRVATPRAFAFLPEDPAVVDAAWEGFLVGKCRFRKAIDRYVEKFLI